MAFPAGPYTNGQLHTENGTQYIYNVDRWDKVVATSAVSVLNDLLDVTVNLPQDGDTLQYDATAAQWVNVPSANKTLSLVTGGRGFGRTVLRGMEILRAGTTGAGRIHGRGFADLSVSTLFPARSTEAVTGWKKFYEGVSYYIALSNEGQVFIAGDDSAGQQGTERVAAGTDSSAILRPLLDPVFTGATVTDIFAPDINLVDGVSQGTFIAVTRSPAGVYKNYTWGANGSYNLTAVTGVTDGNKLFPTEIVDFPVGRYVKAFYGVSFNAHLVVLDDGTVWGIGYNGNGALGTGTQTNPTKYTQAKLTSGAFVTGAKDVLYNFSNGSSTFAYILLETGEVLAAGSNHANMLADGTAAQRSTFNYMLTAAGTRLTNIKKIVGGCYNGVLLLDNSGNVWHAGTNNNNVRGDGKFVDAAPTTPYATICQTGVTEAWHFGAPRSYAQAFYLKNGALFSAGYNIYGTLGSGDTTNGNRSGQYVPFPKGEYPVQMRPLGQIDESGGTYQAYIALTNANRVYAWGRNYAGVSISGLPETVPYPTPINDINNSVT